MEPIAEIINRSQTRQTSQSETCYKHSIETFAKVWRGLQAAKHIRKDSLAWDKQNNRVGTDFGYWRWFLADIDDAGLLRGLSKVATFDGYLTTGAFKKLCADCDDGKGQYYNPYQLPKPHVAGKPLGCEELRRRLRGLRSEINA